MALNVGPKSHINEKVLPKQKLFSTVCTKNGISKNVPRSEVFGHIVLSGASS